MPYRPRPAAVFLAPALCCAAALFLGADLAVAQPAPQGGEPAGQQPAQGLDSLEPRVRSSNNASQFRDQIDRFFDTQLDAFADSATSAAQARTRVVEQVSGNPTSSFEDEFTRSLAQKYQERLGELNAFQRLNLAISVANVAQATENPRLVPVIEKLIADSSPGVALWGVKAARWVLSESMRQSPPGREPLTPAIQAAVERHRRTGPIADDAYVTLQMRMQQGQLDNLTLDRAVPQIVPAALEILRMRLGMYGPGNPEMAAEGAPTPLPPQAPPSPRAEADAFLLVSFPVVWPRQDQQLQLRTIGGLRDAIVVLRDATIRANDSVSAEGIEPEEREVRADLRADVTLVLKNAAQAMQAIVGLSNLGAPGEAIRAAAADLAGQPTVVQNEILREKVEVLLQAIEAAYPNLPPRPEQPAAPATTTAPAEGEAEGGNSAPAAE